MKKIYSTLVLSALSVWGFSQYEGDVMNAKLRGTMTRSHNSGTLRVPTDTLGSGNTTLAINTLPMFAPSGSIYNFGYTGGGYIYGVNISTNDFKEIAQGYQFIGAAASIEGVVFLMIGKGQGPSHTAASAYNIRIYDMSPTGALFYSASGSTNVPGPAGAVLATASSSLL